MLESTFTCLDNVCSITGLPVKSWHYNVIVTCYYRATTEHGVNEQQLTCGKERGMRGQNQVISFLMNSFKFCKHIAVVRIENKV